MKYTLVPVLLALPLVVLGQANSDLFSQFFGATTVTAHFTGTSASRLSAELAFCTNYVHALGDVPTTLPASVMTQAVQLEVDGLCEACVGVSQSRVDSCCGVSTSVECFDQFKSGGSPAQTKPPSVSAMTTPGSNPAATGGAPAATSSSSGERVGVTNIAAPMVAILGFARWFL